MINIDFGVLYLRPRDLPLPARICVPFFDLSTSSIIPIFSKEFKTSFVFVSFPKASSTMIGSVTES